MDEKTLAVVQKAIRGINANADIIHSQYSQEDPSKLINIEAFTLKNVLEMDPEFLEMDPEDHEHDPTVSSVSIRFDGELNHQQLRMWISELQQNKAKDLFRYKGVIAVKQYSCDSCKAVIAVKM